MQRISSDYNTSIADFVGAWMPLSGDAPAFSPEVPHHCVRYVEGSVAGASVAVAGASSVAAAAVTSFQAMAHDVGTLDVRVSALKEESLSLSTNLRKYQARELLVKDFMDKLSQILIETPDLRIVRLLQDFVTSFTADSTTQPQPTN